MYGNRAPGEPKPWLDRLAHDLRSPLTSLQTAAYLLRGDPTGANARELADIVVRQSQRMARMIEELDDWSRAEQGRLVDLGERVEIEGVLDMAIASLPGCLVDPSFAADAHGLVVQGDSTRLVQLFRTLLDQIVSRDAATARVDVAQRSGCAELVFSDRGPGVSNEGRERMLHAPQIPPPDNGLGLRLMIARAIVEGHGGTLAIDGGGVDGGLSFRCALPLAE
jgi:K+-sensing histidine kinase KdpD